jgi:thiol-disulfide isomerase/thioredoxin
MKPLIPLAVAAVLALTGCTGGSQRDAGEVVKYEPAKRIAAPAIRGELIQDGASFDLAATLGKVVVINFWASWCAPCRVEADDLEAVHKELGVDFVGINIRDQKDAANAFHEGRASYPSLFDPAGKLALAFKQVPPNTIPATLIIDSQGRIAVVIRKAIHRDELKPLVAAITAEGAT